MGRRYQHLSAEERYQIFAYRASGMSRVQISRLLGRDKSTIGREIRRNRDADKPYEPKLAEDKARRRRVSRAGQITEFGWVYVRHLIEKDWSPEQIHGWLSHHGWESVPSHEHIYRYIYEDKSKKGTLHTHLRCQKKYRKRYGSGKSKRGQIRNRRDIMERDAIVDQCTRLGDFEGDTVMGARHQGAILTFVDRKSLLLKVAPLPSKNAKYLTKIAIKTLNKTDVYTITFDNGREFADHEKLAKNTHSDIYFAKPYCSWQRAKNENTNGLLRQYFPKKQSLKNISGKKLQQAVDRLNNRPRKTLGWKTPLEVWAGFHFRC